MAKIYISSTYVDLKKEREAADKAVQRLEHQAIAMEYYVASDRRPVDKCLADVKRCDIYIGIFAWRYGSIPHGYDKSITHLEYEAAKQAGTPSLIFLLDDDALWPVKYVDKGKDRQRIERLRRELKNERLVSLFHNDRELSALVTAAVSNLKFPGIMPPQDFPGKPKPATFFSKKCDRDRQVNDFMNFFLEKSKKCPHRPHFYIIHGSDGEGHDSLLERLINNDLGNYAKRQWGENYAAILLSEVPWPKRGSLTELESNLKRTLINRFREFHEIDEFDADTLVRFPYFDKRHLVIIKHNIYSSKWDKQTALLMEWYIKDFWGELDPRRLEEIPLFLVFFNVIYKQEKIWKSNTKKRICKQLQCLLKALDEKCPCKLIEELNPIEPEDVADWLSENKIIQPGWKRKELIDSIFIEDNHPVASICWRKLEKKLLTYLGIIEDCQYHNQYQREESYP
ncbi:MAG: DUF4062 domain-containing protein [Candidatus Aminicenantes bacterium]|jgi:hypothetical protein